MADYEYPGFDVLDYITYDDEGNTVILPETPADKRVIIEELLNTNHVAGEDLPIIEDGGDGDAD